MQGVFPVEEVRAGPFQIRGRDTSHVVRHGAIIFVLSNLGNVFQLLFQRLMAIHLPRGAFGTMNALLNAFALVMGLLCVPIQSVASRDASRFRLSSSCETIGRLFGRWLMRCLVLAALAATPFLFLRSPLARFLRVGDPALLAIVLAWVAPAFLTAGASGVLQGLQHFWRLGAVLAAAGLSRYLFGLIVVALEGGLRWALAVQSLSAAATFALITALLWRDLRRRPGSAAAPPPAGRDLTLPVFASVALLTALQQLDLILVKHYWPRVSVLVDQYAAIQVIGRIVLYLPSALVSVLIPKAVTRAITGGDPRPVLLRALLAAILSGCAVLAIFAAVPDLLFRLLGRSRFAGAERYLLAYGAAMLSLGMLYMTAHYLAILNHWRFLVLLAAALAVEVLWIDADHASAFGVIGKLVVIFGAATTALLAAVFRPGGWTSPERRLRAGGAGSPHGGCGCSGTASPR